MYTPLLLEQQNVSWAPPTLWALVLANLASGGIHLVSFSLSLVTLALLGDQGASQKSQDPCRRTPPPV